MQIADFYDIIAFGITAMFKCFEIMDGLVIIDEPRITFLTILIGFALVELLLETFDRLRPQSGDEK